MTFQQWVFAGLSVIFFGALLLTFFSVALTLIATLGGWRRLAEHYAVAKPVQGRSLRLQSMMLGRFCRYNNAITFTPCDDGLGISMIRIFTSGHRPLLIPWEDFIMTSESRTWGVPIRRFRALAVPDLPITLHAATADRLAAIAGEQWPTEPIDLEDDA